ncbi:MAG: asparagine synthase (glutamine-hydrolyzing) [Chloroflexi bacterium]|nr:asparagine synthase (glutamine-hydrolyzing) [Chloroflexota bacterium]
MCGIAGLFRFGEAQLAPQDGPCLERMAWLLRHRGPDSQGWVLRENCGLANLRLSILDLSPAGAQPMASDDGRLWLVYNGEVYNYLELRTELEALGARFRGGSDTEVVLRAYEAWGDGCVARFVGMWAFALFDTRARRLLLSRDRFGIKPLYYVLADGVLAFASEIKALVEFMRSTGMAVVPNRRSLATYVGTGLVDGLDETFFEGVWRFPAATNAVCTEQGLRQQAYWSLPDAARERGETLAGKTEAAIVAEVRRQLDDAVRIHLRSDVPVGVNLSGGLDSSTVVGLASPRVEQVRTFTLYFQERRFDERPFAERVIHTFRTGATLQEGKAADLLPSLSDILWYLDEPALGPSVYAFWLVMRLASQQVKVVLDGQGGDEVFGGYVPYYTQYLYQLARSGDAVGFAREVWGMGSMLGSKPARNAARNALAMALRPPARNGHIEAPDAVLLRPELLASVDASFNEWRLWPRVFDDWLNNVLYWELYKNRLPALLRYEDRLSMAFSIESRVPLLDHRVVELAFALPARWKIRSGWSKWALRQAMQGVLPEAITWRRDKMGFPMPLATWLRNGLAAEVDDLLLTSGKRALAFLDRPTLQATLTRQAQGQEDRFWLVWRALSLELWLERFKL